MRCPACGQEMKRLAGPDAREVLRRLAPGRELYRAQGGGWYITHGGGEVSEVVVKELLASGQVRSVYSTCPNDAYHIGRTIDMPRTLAYRKGRKRKDWRTFYVDDPPEAEGFVG